MDLVTRQARGGGEAGMFTTNASDQRGLLPAQLLGHGFAGSDVLQVRPHDRRHRGPQLGRPNTSAMIKVIAHSYSDIFHSYTVT